MALAPVVQNLFQDNFATDPNGPISSAKWSFTTGSAEFIPSSVPGGPGTEGTPRLPSVVNGALQLNLQTYNPTGPGTSFQGDDAFTNQSFNTSGGGIAFTAMARFANLPSGGTVDGGAFAYRVVDSAGDKNEIDLESLSNQPNQELTNIYLNAPANSVGNPISVATPSLTAYQTYTIEWFPNKVQWFVNGQLVRTDTAHVPPGSLQFYLDVWAFAPGTGLQPTNNQADNTNYTFQVQSVSVDQIANVLSPARGDFNGDGQSDLLFQNTSGAASIWLMNGATPTSQQTVATPPSDWQLITTGDFNGDAKSDLLWQDTNGLVAIWEMNGLSPILNQIIAAPPPDWHVVACGDLNGDGKSDIIWQDNNGTVSFWEMNGVAPIAQQNIALSPDWHVKGTGDFDGDGKSDVVLQDDNGLVAIWLINGTSITSSQIVDTVPPSMHVISS